MKTPSRQPTTFARRWPTPILAPRARRRFDAALIADARDTFLPRASLVIEAAFGWWGPIPVAHTPVVVDAGPTSDIARRHPNAAPAPGLSDADVLIPGLVNAHAHLDLTHVGPTANDPGAGFVSFVDLVRSRRHAEDHEIERSVTEGVLASLAGGVVAVGDIAGAPQGRPTLAPWRALRESPLAGVSFVEFFAIGRGEAPALARLESFLAGLPDARAATTPRAPGVRLGLQPHATNTVSLDAYSRAARLATRHALPLSTHLAETPEEREFIARGTGPQRTLLVRLNVWDDSILATIGRGLTPVAHLGPILREAPMLCAHVNDADDADLDLLRAARATVAYCPRASAYFGAERHFGPHRFRDMLARGIGVALGTDSIINLEGAHAGDPRRISTLDDARVLFRALSDTGDPDARALLAMCTTLGARALGLDPEAFVLAPGAAPRGLVGVDAGDAARTRPDAGLDACLARSTRPRLMFIAIADDARDGAAP